MLLSPASFVDAQNRKGGIGWNLGCSPNGVLVADASQGSWGQWKALKTAAGNVILESSHTPEFHLAVNKQGQLTHKGGKGKFAQFITKSNGKFWSLKCVAHTENDAYLAVNASGLLYVNTKESKDTRFIAKKVVE